MRKRLKMSLIATLLLCLCAEIVSCVSAQVRQLTAEHQEEMRNFFVRYIETTCGEAAYDMEAKDLSLVLSKRFLPLSGYPYLPQNGIDGLGLIYEAYDRYEIKDLQVIEYSSDRASIQVDWAVWRYTTNPQTGWRSEPNLQELAGTYPLVKEDGLWKIDGWGTVEQVYPRVRDGPL